MHMRDERDQGQRNWSVSYAPANVYVNSILGPSATSPGHWVASLTVVALFVHANSSSVCDEDNADAGTAAFVPH